MAAVTRALSAPAGQVVLAFAGVIALLWAAALVLRPMQPVVQQVEGHQVADARQANAKQRYEGQRPLRDRCHARIERDGAGRNRLLGIHGAEADAADARKRVAVLAAQVVAGLLKADEDALLRGVSDAFVIDKEDPPLVERYDTPPHLRPASIDQKLNNHPEIKRNENTNLKRNECTPAFQPTTIE